jgi:hypothetical protein
MSKFRYAGEANGSSETEKGRVQMATASPPDYGRTFPFMTFVVVTFPFDSRMEMF